MDKYEKIQSVFVLYCFWNKFRKFGVVFFLPKNNTNAISQKYKIQET